MEFITGFSFFVFGAIIGSFLNVVILRYNTGRGINGRSSCFACGTKLQWHELVPVVSFLALRARCRTCRTRLSWQYPLVEIFSGLMFLGLYLQHFPMPEFVLLTAIFSCLIIIFVYDLRHKIIPDGIVYLFAGLSLFKIFLFPSASAFLLTLFTGPLAAFPFAALWFLSKGRWMGFGDAKLSWGMGWFLGPIYSLSAIILGFWIGALVSIFLLLSSRLSHGAKNLTMKSEIPLGPFLIIGLVIVFFFPIDFLGISFFFNI